MFGAIHMAYALIIAGVGFGYRERPRNAELIELVRELSSVNITLAIVVNCIDHHNLSFRFSNTANGAKASAVLYSIVAATAQANGLNTEQYLTELFSHSAGTIILPFTT